MTETDVLIVGGGPAGLAAAIAARRKGLRVIVADREHPPIDKVCGEGLMPDALAALAALGIEIEEEHAFPFQGIRFLTPEAQVDASFPSGQALGVRRPVLHELLIRRAADMGVSLRWGVNVSGLADDGAFVDGQTVRCRWVVGADGQNSRVRRWAGLERYRQESIRFGFRRHYRIAPWTDCMEIYWAEDCQIYTTPVSRDEVCVCVISRTPQVRLEDALRRVPEVVRRLNGALSASSERGAVSASRKLRRVATGRVLLIGDASGSVDAVTGQGLNLAFRQAPALADAMAWGNPAAYQAAHRRLERRPAFMSSLMLSLDRYSWLRRGTMRALSFEPAIFSSLLAFHVGGIQTV
jgi:flavin-dependent dehydrogenase